MKHKSHGRHHYGNAILIDPNSECALMDRIIKAKIHHHKWQIRRIKTKPDLWLLEPQFIELMQLQCACYFYGVKVFGMNIVVKSKYELKKINSYYSRKNNSRVYSHTFSRLNSRPAQ